MQGGPLLLAELLLGKGLCICSNLLQCSVIIVVSCSTNKGTHTDFFFLQEINKQ